MKPIRCEDCGEPYADFGLDTTIPGGQWELIHPEGEGILCASCMVKRASKLPGVIAARMVFDFSPPITGGSMKRMTVWLVTGLAAAIGLLWAAYRYATDGLYRRNYNARRPG